LFHFPPQAFLLLSSPVAVLVVQEHAGRNEMEEFIRNYGIWILLVGVFFAMQWFGMGCGGHRHGSGTDESAAKPGEEKKRTAHSGGCH